MTMTWAQVREVAFGGNGVGLPERLETDFKRYEHGGMRLRKLRPDLGPVSVTELTEHHRPESGRLAAQVGSNEGQGQGQIPALRHNTARRHG